MNFWSDSESLGGFCGVLLGLLTDSPDKVYIGYNDIDQEGTWTWTNAQTSDFTNWAPGKY